MAPRTPSVAPGLRAIFAGRGGDTSLTQTASKGGDGYAETGGQRERGGIERSLPPAGALSCANAAGTTSITITSATRTTAAFFIYCLLANCRQRWFPDTVQRAHTGAANKIELVLLCSGHADVNGGQNRKHVGLYYRNEDVQKYECDRNQGRQHSNENAKDWRFGPAAGKCPRK